MKGIPAVVTADFFSSQPLFHAAAFLYHKHMFRFAVILITLTSLLSASCSLASFETLYNLTSSLKGNWAVEAGIVDVDSAQLINEVYPDAENTGVMTADDNIYSLNSSYTLDLGFSSGTLLAPLGEEAMNSLINASENPVKKKDLSRVLEEKAEDSLAGYAYATVDYLEEFVSIVEWNVYPDIADLFESILPQKDGCVSARDVLDLRIIMYVIENALSFFDNPVVTMCDVYEALGTSFTDADTDFVDTMATALGKAKSACTTTGSIWLRNALNNLLMKVQEGMR